MVLLDTHIVVWLYDDQNQLSKKARAAIETNAIGISAISLLELQYLHEIGRLTLAGDNYATYLRNRRCAGACNGDDRRPRRRRRAEAARMRTGFSRGETHDCGCLVGRNPPDFRAGARSRLPLLREARFRPSDRPASLAYQLVRPQRRPDS